MHSSKMTALIASFAILATGLSACSSTPSKQSESSPSQADKVTVKNCGKEQTFTNKPSKVVSLGVTGLAYLVAAGAEDKVILRANEWGEDPAAWMAGKADNIETVQEPISMEALVAKQPDLVYGGGFQSNGLSPDAVIEKKIPAIVDAPECHYFYPDQKENESFDAILGEITMLGNLLGSQEKAKKTVDDLKSKIDQIAKEKPGQGRSVSYAYYFGEDEELYSYGTKGVMGEISKTLGLTSAIDPNYHPHQGPIAEEAFVKSDPDMIIVLLGMGGATKESTLARLEKIPGYANMKAVKNNKIIFAESAIAYASPTALYGTINLADQIRH